MNNADIENQELKELVNYLRRSIERQVETITELENERVPYANECVEKLKQENKKYKEVIDKSINYISSNDIEVLKYHDVPSETTSYEIVTVDLLKILKEVGKWVEKEQYTLQG